MNRLKELDQQSKEGTLFLFLAGIELTVVVQKCVE